MIEAEKFPTTIAELKAMIDADWPNVRDSDSPVVEVNGADGNPIKMWHAAVIIGREQLFFSEEHACRAFWFEYKRMAGDRIDFTTNSNHETLFWRVPPELDLRHGVVAIYARLAFTNRDRHGDITVPVLFKPEIKESCRA